MKKNRVQTSLFMLMSVDGKISSGANDVLDPDKDWKQIDGVKNGLHQYYEIEQTTDLYSLNTGRVMKKIGINQRLDTPQKSSVSYIIIDNKPHLNENGIKYLCNWLKELIIVTSNKHHPAHEINSSVNNLGIVYYENKINFTELLIKLKQKNNIHKITVQSGGTLNSALIRQGLIDYIKIVIAPLIVGGKDTPTLVDGYSIINTSELHHLKPLKLIDCQILKDSYVLLEYQVCHKTIVD
ncbi:MAG TPA: deaminase [Desulfotomaculum sp.]|nr:MAG: deaminase/reductase [Desulfotomaculum sp. BICA1-6]HBX24251.1 deaminase [Desulfotomaculum sp.]